MTNEKQSDEKESAADIGSVVDVFAICCGGKNEEGAAESKHQLFLQLLCGRGFVV